MKTLTFASKEDAEARSREEWRKRIGRERKPSDVTEFLWAVDGPALVIPDEDAERLPLKERRALSVFVAKADDDAVLDAAKDDADAAKLTADPVRIP